MTKIDGNTIVSTKGTIKRAGNSLRLLAIMRKSFLIIAYIAAFISSILLPAGSQDKINIFQSGFYKIYRIDILTGFYNLSYQIWVSNSLIPHLTKFSLSGTADAQIRSDFEVNTRARNSSIVPEAKRIP